MNHLVLSLRRRALRGAAFACVATALFAVACGSSAPATPEELLARATAATESGRFLDFWELCTDEMKGQFRETVDKLRATIRRNPGMAPMAKQFNCTLEEFHVWTYEQLWVSSHRGTERMLTGARIVEKHTDPQRPTDLIVDVENPRGDRIRWVMRPVPGGGYGLQFAAMMREGRPAGEPGEEK